MKATSLADMKYYLYRSKSKIEMLYSQLTQADKSKKIKWKFDVKAASRETETEKGDITLETRLQAVLRRLEEEDQIGSIDDNRGYIRATLLMRWGLYNDDGIRDPATGTLVYFGSTHGQLLFGMGGSSFNVEGMYGLTSTGARSATPWLTNFLLKGIDTGERPSGFTDLSSGDLQQVYAGMALANHFLKGPDQRLEFVAKEISRDQNCRLRPWQEERGLAILATPLYVAQTVPLCEDDDCDSRQLTW